MNAIPHDVWPITADQAVESMEGCADREPGPPTIHCYIDLGAMLAGSDWDLADAVALARSGAAECAFIVGSRQHDLTVTAGGVTYYFRAWKPADACACPCSCWSRGADGLCDACRMNIHADDRARPRPTLVQGSPS